MVSKIAGERKVRPLPYNNPNDTFKILLSPANFVHIKVGDICSIETSEGIAGPAIAWSADEKIKDDVVQTSKALQKMYGLSPDNRITISPSNQVKLDAHDIMLCEVGLDGSDTSLPSIDEDDRKGWAWVLKRQLLNMDTVSPGLILNISNTPAGKKAFRIQHINSSGLRRLYRIHSDCNLHIIDASPVDGKHHALSVSNDGVGGLSTQLFRINKKIKAFTQETPNFHFHSLHQPCEGGIVLHGRSGTGKSLVLHNIAQAGWRGVFHIDQTVMESAFDDAKTHINTTFSNALGSQPSVVIIDGLDCITTPKDAENPWGPSVRHLLSQQLDRLEDCRTLVVGTVRSLSGIDPDLRDRNYFKTEIEFPVPNNECRMEILKELFGIPQDKSSSTLDTIAARTHGFVGFDLKRLLGQALETYYTRTEDEEGEAGLTRVTGYQPEVLFSELHDDLINALLSVHPTALREAYLKHPEVKWDHIGGQHEVKQSLKEALAWPIMYPEHLKELGIQSKKGLLLYGPPGCSKTMTARAAATELGLNFMTVRGPELMSMYVGESERALREVFSKARAVHPSIIFIDEIDAIGATSAAGQHGGVQTVSTLLNEMDGFVALKEVFILAATNRPEVLDPALLRAGRFDTTIYVGLPDIEARQDILRMETSTMPLGDDVDTKALSEITDGYSGAEIVQLCMNARMATLRERIKSDEKYKVGQRHFDIALGKAEKSVTPEMVHNYMAWGLERR